MFRHFFNAVVLTGLALATRIELLPLLAAVYVLASGSQWFAARARVAQLQDDVESLRAARGVGLTTLDLDNPNHRRRRQSHWWLPVELTARIWVALVLTPMWRGVDALDDRASRGRHARHRWESGQIHGTVGQRRPSAVAGQHAVAAGWRDTTGDLPRITDEQVHGWMAEGAASVVPGPA